MDLISRDLEIMILERAKGEDLTIISRVNKTWRSYITDNPHRMRPIECSRLSIDVSEENPMNLQIRVAITRWERQITHPIRSIYKYKPKKTFVLLASPESTEDRTAIRIALDLIPDWWTDSIGKITVLVYSTLFYGLTSKLKHISQMHIVDKSDPQKIPYTDDVIINSQQVDKFYFTNFTYSLLDAVITKSQTYPTTFPDFDNLPSVKDFIRFMENTKFSDRPRHTGKACLHGSRDEWTTWLQQNTTPIGLSLLPADNHTRRRPVRHNFLYREWKFCITISFNIYSW